VINTFTSRGAPTSRRRGALWTGDRPTAVPGSGRGRTRGKSIFDPVHGPITLDGPALALVATPEFQRLWGIRQTGFAHLVFPGANHTRLEHSLGAYWVARSMAHHLDLSSDDARHLEAAALLHDLGHGPFSHTLDGPMVESLGEGHEHLSRARILGTDPAWPAEEVEVPGVLEKYRLRPERVAELVDPTPGRRSPPLLGALLHGAVDADRIDYLQRDAHYTGVAHGAIDATRLLDTLRHLGGRLVFAEKGRSAVEGFLVGRALMYSTVYFHKTVRAAEMMAQAAVERLPGYPDSVRERFVSTDGEMLAELKRAGGTSGALTAGILARRLYKRAHGLRTVSGVERARWRQLVYHPDRRRAVEDEVAGKVGLPPGGVVIDLAGLDPRGDPAEDWGAVGLLVDDRVTFPFRALGPWRTLASRAPADWAVSFYVAERGRARASEWLGRHAVELV